MLKLSPLGLTAAFGIPGLRDSALRQGQTFTDSALAGLQGKLAPVFSSNAVTPLSRFPVNSYLNGNPDIDVDAWKLEVTGAVARPGRYPLSDLRALPKIEQITRHVCIEGWAVIGSFGGVRLRDFLIKAGADPAARFIEVECADDYYESLDMASALHPQTLLCYEMYGQPLTPDHGAPVRLQLPTKLGYKQAKHLVSLRVSRVLGARRGYWADQGYPWFGGI